jgi:hypothetical protein
MRRAAGLLLVFAVLLVFEPGSTGLLDRLVLPFVASVGGWLIVGRATPVLLAIAALSAVHSAPGSGDVLAGRVYPAAAIVAGATVAAIVLHRFTLRVRATRDERQLARQERRSLPDARSDVHRGAPPP